MKVKDLKRELENIDDNDDVKFSIVEWDRIQCKHVELTVL